MQSASGAGCRSSSRWSAKAGTGPVRRTCSPTSAASACGRRGSGSAQPTIATCGEREQPIQVDPRRPAAAGNPDPEHRTRPSSAPASKPHRGGHQPTGTPGRHRLAAGHPASPLNPSIRPSHVKSLYARVKLYFRFIPTAAVTPRRSARRRPPPPGTPRPPAAIASNLPTRPDPSVAPPPGIRSALTRTRTPGLSCP